MRDIKHYKPYGKANSLRNWYRVKNPLRIAFNFIIIYTARYLPSIRLKNALYRITGAKIGKDVSFALGAIPDIFYPEMIEIGDNSIIGFNATILAHEFIIDEWRVGKVKIGKNVVIGANSTILPGIEIGDNSIISAMSLVNKNVPENTFAGGVPVRKIKMLRNKGR